MIRLIDTHTDLQKSSEFFCKRHMIKTVSFVWYRFSVILGQCWLEVHIIISSKLEVEVKCKCQRSALPSITDMLPPCPPKHNPTPLQPEAPLRRPTSTITHIQMALSLNTYCFVTSATQTTALQSKQSGHSKAVNRHNNNSM